MQIQFRSMFGDVTDRLKQECAWLDQGSDQAAKVVLRRLSLEANTKPLVMKCFLVCIRSTRPIKELVFDDKNGRPLRRLTNCVHAYVSASDHLRALIRI